MTSAEKETRLEELKAEVKFLRAFIDAVERGEHDDEEAIAAVPVHLREQARSARRASLSLQALNRITKEIYPEIHRLNFEIQFGQ